MNASTLDLIIIIGAVAFAAYGFYKGVIHQIGSVAALIIGYLAARAFGYPLSQSLGISQFICAAVVYIIAYFAIVALAKLVKITVRMVLLGPIDRILGSLFAIIKWLFITSLLLNLFMFCKPDAGVIGGKVTQFTLDFLPKLLGIAQQCIS